MTSCSRCRSPSCTLPSLTHVDPKHRQNNVTQLLHLTQMTNHIGHITTYHITIHIMSISNSIKRGALAIKRPARWGSFSKTLLNDPNQAGRLIANHLFLCYYFVISCLREFLLFSRAVDVNPGLFRTNQTWFDVISKMCVRTKEIPVRTKEIHANMILHII